MSWVAMATRIAGPDNGPCASSSVSMMRSLRVAVMVFSAIPEGIEVIGGGEVQIRLKDIGDLEDQVARALIENGAFVLGAEPIEDWKTDPHERNAETLGGLAAMAVGDKLNSSVRSRSRPAAVSSGGRLRAHPASLPENPPV